MPAQTEITYPRSEAIYFNAVCGAVLKDTTLVKLRNLEEIPIEYQKFIRLFCDKVVVKTIMNTWITLVISGYNHLTGVKGYQAEVVGEGYVDNELIVKSNIKKRY